jgi:hypothetical protein
MGPRPTPAGQRKGEFRRRSTAPPPTDPGVDPLGRRVPYKEDFPRRGRGIRFSRVWYVRLARAAWRVAKVWRRAWTMAPAGTRLARPAAR